jgi:general secretion pathway protein J
MADRARGFTLLELLVVILILSMIVVALSGGVHFAGRAWETQERQIDRSGDIGAVQGAVREIVASARDFEGDDQSFKCVGQLPKGLDRGGLYDLELHVADGRLLLSWKPHFTGSETPPASTDTELLKGVTALQLGYFVDSNWQAESKDKSKTPLLMRISVTFENGQPWPSLVIRPMVDMPPGAQQ